MLTALMRRTLVYLSQASLMSHFASRSAACRKTKLQNVLKQATIQLGKTEQKPDPLKEAPALKRKIEKALAMHHGVLTAQIEAVMAAWELLQQQVVSDMAWRELEMQVGARF
jgi:hypothetical protein